MSERAYGDQCNKLDFGASHTDCELHIWPDPDVQQAADLAPKSRALRYNLEGVQQWLIRFTWRQDASPFLAGADDG